MSGTVLTPDAPARGIFGSDVVSARRMNGDIVVRDQPMQYVTRLRREGRGGKTNDGHFQSREALTLMGARGGQTAAEGVMGDKRATPFLQQTPTSDVFHHQALAGFSP